MALLALETIARGLPRANSGVLAYFKLPNLTRWQACG